MDRAFEGMLWQIFLFNILTFTASYARRQYCYVFCYKLFGVLVQSLHHAISGFWTERVSFSEWNILHGFIHLFIRSPRLHSPVMSSCMAS
jgi:hypothetical protein